MIVRDACPLCGREMHVPRHREHTPWTPQAKLWVSRMQAVGIPVKVIARTMGVPHGALVSMLYDKRSR